MKTQNSHNPSNAFYRTPVSFDSNNFPKPNIETELPSLKNMSEEERALWEQKISKKIDISKATEYQKEQIYRDQKYIEKFGVDTFKNNPNPLLRNKQYRNSIHQEYDDLIKSTYKNDPRLPYFLDLDLKYKKRLFDEEIIPLTQDEIANIYDDIRLINDVNDPYGTFDISGQRSNSASKRKASKFLDTFFGVPYDPNVKAYESSEKASKLEGGTFKLGNREVKVIKAGRINTMNDDLSSPGFYNVSLTPEEENFKKAQSILSEAHTEDRLIKDIKYRKELKAKLESLSEEEQIEFIDNLADEIGSKYNKVYGESYELSRDQKLKAFDKYKRDASSMGESAAFQNFALNLDDSLQDIIAEDQGILETVGKGISNIATGVTADLLFDFNLIRAKVTMDDDEFAEWLTVGQGAFLQDASQAGSFNTETIDLYRETGLSENIPVWTNEQERDWTSGKSFYDVAVQSKWLVEQASMTALTGGVGNLLSGGVKAGSTALKALSVANRGYSTSKKIIKGIDATTNTLNFIGNKARYFIDALPIAAQEGASAAREVYDQALVNFEAAADNYAKQKLSENKDRMAFIEFKMNLLNANPDLTDTQIESIYNKALYDQYVEEYKNNNYDKFELAKNDAVNASFNTTFTLSTVKTAITNKAFRTWVYKTAPTYKYGTKELSNRMKLNSSGKLDKVPMTQYEKYVKPFIHNPITEGTDELADVMISSFGTGVGNSVYNKHYNGNYNNDFDTLMSYIYSGIISSGNALYEESTWREAWLGALSGGIGITPNIKGIVGVFRDNKKDGTSYTKLERLSQFITNPILNDVALNQRQEIEAQKIIDVYNKELEKHQETFKSMSSVSSALSELEKAEKLGNAAKVRQARQNSAFEIMSLLNELEADGIVGDSQIVKSALETLSNAAEGNISEEEVQEFLKSLSDEERANFSNEDAKNELQNKAKELLKVRDDIQRIRKNLNSFYNFRNSRKDIQKSLIESEYNIERWKQTIKELSEEIGITSEDFDDQIVGSKKDLLSQNKAYDDTIQNLKNTLKKLKENPETDSEKAEYNKLLIKEIEYSISILRSKMIKLNSKYEALEDGKYADTIKSEEMGNLDAASLLYLLDDENKNLFSKEQQEEIKLFKSVKNLTKEDIENIKELRDLQQSVKISEKSNKVILSNLDALSAHLNIADSTEVLLNKNNNIQRLFSLMDSEFLNLDGTRTISDSEMLAKLSAYDVNILKEYIKERKNVLNEDDLRVLNIALYKAELLLEVSNIISPIKNTLQNNKIVDDTIISIIDGGNYISLKEFYKELLSSTEDLSDDLKKDFNKVLKALEDRLDNEELKDKLEKPITPDRKDDGNNPINSVEPEVKLTPEEEKKIAPEVPKIKPEDMQRGDTNPNAESELITFALNLASKGINGYTKETRQRVEGIINNASPYCTKEELSEYLLAEANRLDSQSSDENDSYASSLLRQCASKVANRKDPNESPQEGERRETLNIFEKNNSRASNIESLNMDQVVRDYPNSPNAKFYEKYKVREFLGSNQISNRTPVVFISDPSFVEEVEESMRSNGANPTVYSLPLVAAVEVESGGIEIDGKHYQPIAIMPATDSQTKRGASRLGDVRNRAYKQKDSGKVELVKDEEGDVITTTIYGNVNAEPPTQIKPEVPNKSAHTLLVNDASESDRRELQNLSKADRRKSPIYQRIKSSFLSKLSHRKTEKGEELVYNVPNLKGNEEIPIIALVTSSHKTVDRNSDELIIDLVKRGDKSALKSNSRIVRYTKALNKFFSETFNTSEFSFEQDDSGNVVPSESTKKALDNYAAQLDNILGNFLNLPSRSGWKYKIESTGRVVDGKIEYNLSIQDSYDNIINLASLTEGKISEDTQLEVIRNLMVDSNTGEARMRDSKYGFVVWNVVFTDAGNNSEGAKNNMADIFDDDIIEFSKESLKYTIKGVTLNAPFSGLGEPLYKKGNQGTSVGSGITTENEIEEILAKAHRDPKGHLLAPNDKPTKLSERQYAQVRTKAFKEWFGDWTKITQNEDGTWNIPNDVSKVIDEETGEPKVVYHGSTSDFTVFDINYFGKTDGGSMGKGFYFGTHKSYTEKYYGNTKEFFLNLKNPLDAKLNEIQSFLLGSNTLEEALTRISLWDDISEEDKVSIENAIRDLGSEIFEINKKYDGAWYIEGKTGDEIVVLNPTQIISATSIENDNIYDNTEDSTTNTDSTTGVVTVGNTTIDADTGAVIGVNVQTESVQEQAAEVESKPIEMPTPGKVRNRFEDSLDSKTPTKTVSPKYQWGVFEGAKMSVDEITDALFDQDIYTEEDWNNLSEQEKDRVLKCCGAL